MISEILDSQKVNLLTLSSGKLSLVATNSGAGEGMLQPTGVNREQV